MKSLHVVGGVGLAETATQSGATISITVHGFFRGDTSDRGGPAVHLKGQILNRRFKAVLVDKQSAAKLGHQKWQCSSSAPAPPGSLSMGNLANPARQLRKLVRRHRIVNLGAATFRGVAVWHIRSLVLLRVPLNPASLIQPSPIGPHSGSGSAKAHYIWLHVMANFWISQDDYTLRRVTASVLYRMKHGSLKLSLWARLSRYGERVPIQLPPACAG